MFGLKNTAADVAVLIERGLRDGSICLDSFTDHDARQSAVTTEGFKATELKELATTARAEKKLGSPAMTEFVTKVRLNRLRDDLRQDAELLTELDRFQERVTKIFEQRTADRKATRVVEKTRSTR
ncbi:MAG: hypothetical protein M3O31_07260 [Acidobacteriota bacterium]|nr:hypothetical protein [Acidobacteriota bacterium]